MVNQRGISGIGILFGVGLFAVILTLGLRIGPLYLDNQSLDSAIQSAGRSNNLRQMTTTEIHSALGKSFQINTIRNVRPQDIEVIREGDQVELVYVHEERVNLYGNLDVIVTFTNRYSTADN